MPSFLRTQTKVLTSLLVGFLSFASTSAAHAELPKKGPALGAASNFSQGAQPNMLRLAHEFGVTLFRDGMSWRRAETRPGIVQFDNPRTDFPDTLQQLGASTSIVLNWGNPLYDQGNTPYSANGIAQFGRFAADVAARFSALDSLEIGNEFNGTNFVKGPLSDMSPKERARAYTTLLESAAKQVRANHPELRIMGGATHSIPVGYIWEILDNGGADYMNSLAIHPYTTRAEHFPRQVAVLRQHPEAADLPLEITEFGHPDPALAPGHMLRNYCQFAVSGVSHAIWYPLNPRGDGMVPLLERTGRITSAGQAWQLIRDRMESEDARAYDGDAFTYGCFFGDDTLVLWGAPRSVTVADRLQVVSGTNTPLEPPYELSMTHPLVIKSTGDAALPESPVTLGPQSLLADSFHQFQYLEREKDGFERFALRQGKRVDLDAMPGQERRNEIWTPYLGRAQLWPLRITPEALRPAIVKGEPVDIVHRYTAKETGLVNIAASFKPATRSEDGISVELRMNDEVLFSDSGKSGVQIDLADITMEAGEHLDFIIGPNGNARGDGTRYRITIDAP